MKKIIYKYLIFIGLIAGLNGCDKGFEEINTDPIRQTTIDPAYLFAKPSVDSA